MDAGAIGLLGLLATGVVLLLGLWQLASASARRGELRDRAAAIPDEGFARRLRRQVDDRIRSSERGRALFVAPVDAAGLDLRPYQLLGLALLVAFASYQLAAIFAPAWAAIAFAAGCVRVVWVWIDWKRRQRLERFVAQLPELAQLLSNGASAGLSIVGALERAQEELPEPARSEVMVVREQMRIGQSLDLALERLRDRMPSRELGVLVGTLVIQQRSGGDVVSALQNMSDALEQRKDLKREVSTLMSGAIFTAYVVVALGVGTVFLLNAISPGVLDRMLASPVGIGVFLFAGTLYTIGLLLVRSVTRIET